MFDAIRGWRKVNLPLWDIADDEEGEQSDTEDRDFSLHDSEYDSEEDTLEQTIDEEEIRRVNGKICRRRKNL